MGVIILVVCTTILAAFFTGVVISVKLDSEDDEHSFGFIIAFICILACISLSVGVIHEYVENKEYSSTKYNLKKKVITTEEDNTVKLDTIYTFIHK